MRIMLLCLVLAPVFVAGAAFAGDAAGMDHERIRALVGEVLDEPREERREAEVLDELSDFFAAMFPRVEITGIDHSPVDGLIEIEINRSQYVYATPDLRHVIAGEMLELGADGPVSVAERHREDLRQRVFSEELDPDSRISFVADAEQAEIYVFTDPTCGYCQRLHRQMDAYNERGITVHYLAFPRDGGSGDITDELGRIWCAENPHQAMDQAKLQRRITVPTSDCEAPVQTHFRMGQQLGVSGTPGVFSADGRQLGGFVPPEQLVEALGLENRGTD